MKKVYTDVAIWRSSLSDTNTSKHNDIIIFHRESPPEPSGRLYKILKKHEELDPPKILLDKMLVDRAMSTTN